jgi:hypothetical protein
MRMTSPNSRIAVAGGRYQSTWLVLRAWLTLLRVGFVMSIGSLNAVHRMVRGQGLAANTSQSVSGLCAAVDLACVLYFKRVLCLQRSAATAVMLRKYGWDAAMVIGVQILPFQSHAWVESQGAVVNDKSYIRDTYRVLERC